MLKSRIVAALGIAALLLVLPASAMANVGGAGPRMHNIDKEHPTVSNVGGAGPRSTLEQPAQEFANVGGAGPTTNVGGAGPRSVEQDSTESLRNVGGAGPRTLTQWFIDLLVIN
jgi:hypothetical protein